MENGLGLLLLLIPRLDCRNQCIPYYAVVVELVLVDVLVELDELVLVLVVLLVELVVVLVELDVLVELEVDVVLNAVANSSQVAEVPLVAV